jgi:hypothetical protein
MVCMVASNNNLLQAGWCENVIVDSVKLCFFFRLSWGLISYSHLSTESAEDKLCSCHRVPREMLQFTSVQQYAVVLLQIILLYYCPLQCMKGDKVQIAEFDTWHPVWMWERVLVFRCKSSSITASAAVILQLFYEEMYKNWTEKWLKHVLLVLYYYNLFVFCFYCLSIFPHCGKTHLLTTWVDMWIEIYKTLWPKWMCYWQVFM